MKMPECSLTSRVPPIYSAFVMLDWNTHTNICTMQVGSAQRVLYRWSGAQRRYHKSRRTLGLTTQVPLVHHGAQCMSVVHIIVLHPWDDTQRISHKPTQTGPILLPRPLMLDAITCANFFSLFCVLFLKQFMSDNFITELININSWPHWHAIQSWLMNSKPSKVFSHFRKNQLQQLRPTETKRIGLKALF